MNKNAGISTLKGIGEKTEKLFLKLGVATVDDLLHYYPRTYEISACSCQRSSGRTYLHRFRCCFRTDTGVRDKKYAGDNSLFKRSDRNFKSDLVPYAFFKEYIRQERPGHFTWQSGS